MSFSNANAVGLSSASSICLFATSGTIACQAPLFIALPRQEYCSGVLFPFPGDLPPPAIKPTSPTLAVDSLPLSHQGRPMQTLGGSK